MKISTNCKLLTSSCEISNFKKYGTLGKRCVIILSAGALTLFSLTKLGFFATTGILTSMMLTCLVIEGLFAICGRDPGQQLANHLQRHPKTNMATYTSYLNQRDSSENISLLKFLKKYLWD